MLGEDKFWNLIDESLEHSKDQSKQERYLIDKLTTVSPEDIQGFYVRSTQLIKNLESLRPFCHQMRFHSDDGFLDFRCWIVSQGKAFYDKVKAEPDYLIPYFSPPQFEAFLYVADKAMEEGSKHCNI